MNGTEQDVRASYCERQHAHHEGQDQENGVDCIDAENDRGAGDEPDGKDGRNSRLMLARTVGCNTTLNTRREAKSGGEIVIKRVMPRQNEEVNEIWLCDKGRFAYHYAESKDRLSKPLIRKENKLARASGDAATNLAAEKFLRDKKDFVILASGRLSNEDVFNLKTLADHAGGKAYFVFAHGRR